ncbi:pyruvate:ferredoxin (flavodoxin) oxidoreductase [Spirochaetia bacterium]|nr:pyruvate:ferredoxin (flavodoxin) oxidoreductase [Spirochaetia bacterium]
MILNCLITGVGGQGTVLMSRLIGGAAIKAGLEVRGAETIGMAQRGGSVVSHLRMGEGANGIHSPLIAPAEADIIIAFEPAEAVRVLPFLAPSGSMIVLNRGIPPVTSALGDKKYNPNEMIVYLKKTVAARLTVIDGEELIARCGNPRVINVALLGAALAKGLFPFNADDIAALIKERLAPKFVEINLNALETGRTLPWK